MRIAPIEIMRLNIGILYAWIFGVGASVPTAPASSPHGRSGVVVRPFFYGWDQEMYSKYKSFKDKPWLWDEFVIDGESVHRVPIPEQDDRERQAAWRAAGSPMPDEGVHEQNLIVSIIITDQIVILSRCRHRLNPQEQIPSTYIFRIIFVLLKLQTATMICCVFDVHFLCYFFEARAQSESDLLDLRTGQWVYRKNSQDVWQICKIVDVLWDQVESEDEDPPFVVQTPDGHLVDTLITRLLTVFLLTFE